MNNEHHPTISHSHTYLCSARFVANITRQDNHQAHFHAMCKLHPEFQGKQLVQNFATHTQINAVFT